MRPFTFTRADSVESASRAAAGQGGEAVANPSTQFIAGGTNLVDLMKSDIARPNALVDLTRLPLRSIEELPGGGLRVGALVSNADLAHDPRVEARYPLLAEAILAGASPQLRNVATTGGNLLQRTRCYYFTDPASACNKRDPGSGCDAIGGFNRIHAIFGGSEHCVATHPSDMCVALAALGATVRVHGVEGDREIPFAEFHRLPGDTPHRDHNLRPGEVITAIDLPGDDFAEHSRYLKVRDRASYAFALVSVAAALRLDGTSIREARLAIGGVAHRPWRDPEAEARLAGREATESTFREVADFVVRDAAGLDHNAFKISLTRQTVIQALLDAAAGRSQVAAPSPGGAAHGTH